MIPGTLHRGSGVTGQGGSIWTDLGNRLIEEGVFDQVLIAPIAVGGTKVSRWVPGGDFNDRIKRVFVGTKFRSPICSGIKGKVMREQRRNRNGTNVILRGCSGKFKNSESVLRFSLPRPRCARIREVSEFTALSKN